MDWLNMIKAGDIVSPKTGYSAKSTDVSAWFKDETLELTFGESEGRPSASFVMRKEYLTRFLENGWTVAAVVASAEGGDWKSVSTAKRNTETGDRTSDKSSSTSERRTVSSDKTRSGGSTTTSDESSSTSSSVSSSNQASASNSKSSGSNSSSEKSDTSPKESGSSTEKGSSSSNSSDSNTTQTQTSDSRQDTNSRTSSSGRTDKSEDSTRTVDDRVTESNVSDSSRSSFGNSDETTDTESAAAYWAAYHRIMLKRRRMVPEYVLKSMLDTFTDAYNTGHGNEDSRYNEIVSLYTTTLAVTEREMDDLVSKGVSLDRLYDHIYWSFYGSLKSAEDAAKRSGDDGLAAALDEIRRRFDALLAKARSELISAGLYNGTVWITTEAGIERQRAAAILAAKADSAKSGVDANLAVVSAKNSAYAILADIRKAMADLSDKRRTTATEMRNTVVKWLADVIAAKKDDAPQIEEFAQLVQTFGFSVGAAGNVL